MLAFNPTLAKQVVLFGMNRPVIPISEAAKLAGVSVDTVRNFRKHGIIKLRFMKSEGYGVPVLFSFHDVIEIMAASELYHLNVAPKGLGSLSEEIATFTIYQIQEVAGIFGSSPTPENFQRYIVIFYNERIQEIEASIESDPAQSLDMHTTKIVVDCRKLAIKAVYAFVNYKQ